MKSHPQTLRRALARVVFFGLLSVLVWQLPTGRKAAAFVCPTITVGPSSLPLAQFGVPYGQTLTASGGLAPYTFAVTSGVFPPGLTLATDGAITGMPTQAGGTNFTVTATDANGCPGSQFFVFAIQCPPLSIAPTTLPNPVVAVPYNQAMTGVGGVGPFAFTPAGGTIPPGLSLIGTAITGTPTTRGTFFFGFTMDDLGLPLLSSVPGPPKFCKANLSYGVTVVCPTVTVAPASLPSGQFGVAYNQTLTASGGTAPYTFAVTTGTLPPGLTLATNGAITGTPTQIGGTNFIVTATDANGCTGARSYTVGVQCPTISIAPASLPNPVAGVAYNQTLTGTGGVGPYTFALIGGALPSGLNLVGNAITGTPTTLGTFTFSLLATDSGLSNSCNGNRTFTVRVQCQTVTLSPATLPNGTVGASYNQALTTTPTGGFSFVVSAGALPNGLTLSAGGVVNGTASSMGTFSFTITATNAAAGDQCSGSRNFTVTIGCGAGATLSPNPLPAALAGVAYNQALTVSPAGSYTFAITQGSLPSGLTINSATGVLSGLPSVAGTHNFTISAIASSGCGGVQNYTLAINCPAISLSDLTIPELNQPYNQTLTATPAGGNYSYVVTSGALPLGLSLNAATGVISGTTTAGGSYSFNVTATGFGSCTGNRTYSGTIGSGSCPTITLPDLPNGTPGQLYNQSVAASPSGSYSYAVTAGSLPPGVTLFGEVGLLFGHPTSAGTFAFTITATTGSNCSGSRQFEVIIGGAATRSLVFGDFDGDGKADASIWRGSAGDWLIVNSSNGKLKTEHWGTSAAPYFDVMTPGDYDGDGKMDLAVFRRATGQWLIKGSRDGAISSEKWGVATDVPVPGDYDGDGKTDLAVWRGAESNWYIRRSSDQQTQIVSWGTSRMPYRDVPVAADFDGDGKTDIAVFRQANGHWYIKLSSDGATLDRAWGLGTDVPVAADYDGDGKADIAVWRGTETNWYILRSSDGVAQIIAWGTSDLGDVPVPGDYDGDGKTDVAVWRARDGNWYVKRSAGGEVMTKAHGQAGDTPIPAKQR